MNLTYFGRSSNVEYHSGIGKSAIRQSAIGKVLKASVEQTERYLNKYAFDHIEKIRKPYKGLFVFYVGEPK